MQTVIDTENLLNCTNYQVFLKTLYQTNKKINSQFSYSYLAKKCGFSSKSFIKDVIDGKKKLTYESSIKVIHGLSLPQIWKAYLENLIKLEINIFEQEKIVFKKNLNQIKQKIQNSKKTEKSKDASIFFQEKNWPYVYAALGHIDTGVTLNDIIKKTRLTQNEVLRIIEFLIKNELVSKNETNYFPLNNTAFFANLGDSNFFKNFFLQSILNTANRSQKKLNSNNELYFSISLPVQSLKMKQFKTELAELLDKFSISAEDNDGDRIAEIVCGFSLI